MKLERVFNIDEDEKTLRTRLLTGMKKLGFKELTSHSRVCLKFKRGSRLAALPNYLTYAEIAFSRNDSILMKATVTVPFVPHWAVLPRIRDIWDCLMNAIGLIALSDDSSRAIETFLDVTKQATKINLVLLGLPFLLLLYVFLRGVPGLMMFGASVFEMGYAPFPLKAAVLIIIGLYLSFVTLIAVMVALGVYYYANLARRLVHNGSRE